jgi:hypothetical protein
MQLIYYRVSDRCSSHLMPSCRMPSPLETAVLGRAPRPASGGCAPPAACCGWPSAQSALCSSWAPWSASQSISTSSGFRVLHARPEPAPALISRRMSEAKSGKTLQCTQCLWCSSDEACWDDFCGSWWKKQCQEHFPARVGRLLPCTSMEKSIVLQQSACIFDVPRSQHGDISACNLR